MRVLSPTQFNSTQFILEIDLIQFNSLSFCFHLGLTQLISVMTIHLGIQLNSFTKLSVEIQFKTQIFSPQSVSTLFNSIINFSLPIWFNSTHFYPTATQLKLNSCIFHHSKFITTHLLSCTRLIYSIQFILTTTLTQLNSTQFDYLFEYLNSIIFHVYMFLKYSRFQFHL